LHVDAYEYTISNKFEISNTKNSRGIRSYSSLYNHHIQSLETIYKISNKFPYTTIIKFTVLEVLRPRNSVVREDRGRPSSEILLIPLELVGSELLDYTSPASHSSAS
jgi:hypothetical protein